MSTEAPAPDPDALPDHFVTSLVVALSLRRGATLRGTLVVILAEEGRTEIKAVGCACERCLGEAEAAVQRLAAGRAGTATVGRLH